MSGSESKSCKGKAVGAGPLVEKIINEEYEAAKGRQARGMKSKVFVIDRRLDSVLQE